MEIARITSKGQVTIPVEVRKALRVERGDYLVFQEVGPGEASIRVIRSRGLSSLRGALPATRPFPGKRQVREEVAEALAREAERRPPGGQDR